MDLFFRDPSETPLPPAEVRIRELRAEPWPDGRRVRVYLEVDPTQKRPSAEVHITTAQDELAAQANVVESMSRKMEFTMHIRRPDPQGKYRLRAVLFFTEPLPPPTGDQPAEIPLELPERLMVDQKAIEFEAPPASG